MKKFIALLSLLLICILCISCDGIPWLDRGPEPFYTKFRYPEEEIVAMQIVYLGEQDNEGFYELTTIVEIEDYESALKEFRMIECDDFLPGFMYSDNIGVKIDYANGHYQIFTDNAHGATVGPNQWSTDKWFASQASYAVDKEVFYNFLIKYVEMYGGDVQIVLDKFAERNN